MAEVAAGALEIYRPIYWGVVRSLGVPALVRMADRSGAGSRYEPAEAPEDGIGDPIDD